MFEFDGDKSRANESKHGIDFVEAQALWLDEAFVEIPARTEDEPRFLVVGMISGKHWSAVTTYRGESVAAELGASKIRRPAQEQRRVNVDFPSWMIESLDRKARRLGVTRQSIIKVWIAERLERKVS